MIFVVVVVVVVVVAVQPPHLDPRIAYTWASDRWRLPALYWMQRVEYPDQDANPKSKMQA